MNVNLVLAAGVSCSVSGALLMLVAHLALRRAVDRVTVAYPRDLARREAQRQDRRFGFNILACGGILHALAAFGYSAPVSLWRYPAGVAVAAVAVYCLCRFAASRGKLARPRRASAQRSSVGRLYETPRSYRLREAAQLQSASLRAIEAARDPRDNGVVYLTRDWDCRWWSDRFGVSTEVLRAVMRQVGPMSKDIERHLSSVRGA